VHPQRPHPEGEDRALSGSEDGLPGAIVRVGFFGQNFDDLPFLKDWVHSNGLMRAMIAICLVPPAGMLARVRW
jgi:hypothetical protein